MSKSHFTVKVGKSSDRLPRDERDHRNSKGVLYIRNLPAAVKTRFAANCRLHEDSMQDVIQALMRLYNHNPDCILKHLPRRNK